MSSEGGGGGEQQKKEQLELSVDETNKLRAQLGLKPLRGTAGAGAGSSSSRGNAAGAGDAAGKSSSNNAGGGQEKEVLEMSVDETNALRASLGLAPLRGTAGSTSADASSSSKSIIHAPAINMGAEKEAAARIERARLQRQVEQGMTKTFGQESLAEESSTATSLSWAQQMRKQKQEKNTSATTKDDSSSSKKMASDNNTGNYEAQDLAGMNVAHSLGELQEGATTVLTMADTEILHKDIDTSNKTLGLNEDDDVQLENVHLAEQRHQQDGLREKRKMELGQGRAGGYAGFDDDEFEELGGTQGPSRAARGSSGGGDNQSRKKKNRGFQIGAALQEREEEEESDLFAAQAGKAISLNSTTTGVENSTASDFMTAEEEQAQLQEQEEARLRKKKKKDGKFKKSKKKKKDKKQKKRRVESDDDEEEEDEELRARKEPPVSTKSLLDELEETADAEQDSSGHLSRKRKRSSNSQEDDDDAEMEDADSGADTTEIKQMHNQRARYDAIMAKGNARTKAAFQPATKTSRSNAAAAEDEEPDDAFLNAAISKARRLNRLKAMSESSKQGGTATSTADEAIAASLQQQKQQQQQQQPDAVVSAATGGKTVAFSVDDTREFTRSLRARAEQAEREQARKAAKKEKTSIQVPDKSLPSCKSNNDSEDEEDKGDKVKVEDVAMDDMEKLAKEVKVEDDAAGHGVLDGAIGGASVPLGRGIGNVLSMLKQTGEITRKNAGKEEQKGRARDEHVENEVDLSEVVRIDERTATDKDKELAKRSIKLEYRDKHGRLLTPKEAYRDLSYHFHGYGSGKRKEEKKLQQIAREQAEARMAQQASEGGSFGALKKTQKATGKAFVVHKT